VQLPQYPFAFATTSIQLNCTGCSSGLSVLSPRSPVFSFQFFWPCSIWWWPLTLKVKAWRAPDPTCCPVFPPQDPVLPGSLFPILLPVTRKHELRSCPIPLSFQPGLVFSPAATWLHLFGFFGRQNWLLLSPFLRLGYSMCLGFLSFLFFFWLFSVRWAVVSPPFFVYFFGFSGPQWRTCMQRGPVGHAASSLLVS